MPSFRLLPLVSAMIAGLCAAEEPAQCPTLNRTEIPLKSRTDEFVQSKELWFRSQTATQWGEWQKHGLGFGREAPVVWSNVPEGHWQTYVRYIEVNGAEMSVPAKQENAGLFTEFIIDRTNPAATVITPATKAKLRGGQKTTVKWEVADVNLTPNSIKIEYARSGDGDFVAVVGGLSASGVYEWDVPGNMTISGTLRVSATDMAGNVGSSESVQLLIDSIAPRGVVTGPVISSNPQVELALNVADAGPAGVASARVWVSADNGQTWTEGPVIESPFTSVAWQAPRDGRYRLAVVASDQAGNQSVQPKGAEDGQGQLLVDTTKPVILLAQAGGLVEAQGMKPRNVFKPGDRVAVQFEVKDTAVAQNPVSIWMSLAPGKWEQLGKDQPADSAFRFDMPAKDTVQGRIKVTAIDQAGNLGEAIATETFIIRTQVDVGDPGLQGLDL